MRSASGPVKPDEPQRLRILHRFDVAERPKNGGVDIEGPASRAGLGEDTVRAPQNPFPKARQGTRQSQEVIPPVTHLYSASGRPYHTVMCDPGACPADNTSSPRSPG